jgi:four helix bundle protein
MSGYKELEIYQLAYALSIKVHHSSLKLPKFELYEQGSQIRRSSKSIRDTISEGYGRRRYKAEYIKYLVYSQASCDEILNHLDSIIDIYPEIPDFPPYIPEYVVLGKKINNYILWVENNWNAEK